MLFDMEGWLHINKHSKNVDTGTLYTTNHLQLANKKTDYGTTYSSTSPPFSENVSTNIRNRFFALVDKGTS